MEPERCEECGFDATRLTTADAIAALRSLGRRWKDLFEDVPEDVLRKRPGPDTWSALEYAAHTRDVIAMNAWGMDEILTKDRPVFPAIEPDAEASDYGYNALDPARVLTALERNANAMADRAEGELPAHWSRTGVLGDQEVDAGYVLRHAVHDATHHLRDVEIGLERLS